MARYLEDLVVGAEYRSAGRTITESDIVAFAGISGDFSPLHTDELWVRANTPFRGRIAHGLLVLGISSGLATPGLQELEVVAYLEERRRFTAPTYPGDTIHAVFTVTSARPSASRPGLGVATVEVAVVNQRGETVQAGEDVWLVNRRPPEDDDATA